MIYKFTSTMVVMAITTTTTNAMWVPDSEYRLNKRAVSDPVTATKTTEAHTTTKKDSAPTFKNSEPASTSSTPKKTNSSASKPASSSSSSSSNPAETHNSSSSNAATTSARPTSVVPTLTTSTGGLTSSISTPSSSATPAASSGGSSSAGMIGGIVAAAAVAVVGISAFMVIRKRQNRRAMRAANMKPDPFTQGFGSDDIKPYNNDFPPQTTYQQNQTSTFDNYEVAAISHSNNEVIQQQQQYQPQYQPQIAPITVTSAPIVAPAAAATTAVAATAATTPTTAQFQQPSLGLFIVIATYIPTLSDELEIETGDQIELLVEYDDGWCQGINISKGHTKGVFPRHCIDYATAPSNHTPNLDVERSKRVSSMYKP